MTAIDRLVHYRIILGVTCKPANARRRNAKTLILRFPDQPPAYSPGLEKRHPPRITTTNMPEDHRPDSGEL